MAVFRSFLDLNFQHCSSFICLRIVLVGIIFDATSTAASVKEMTQ